MNLVRWSPKVTARYVLPDHVSEASLTFTGTLRCPVCEHTAEVETSGHLLGGPALCPVELNVQWEFNYLVMARGCDNCGVVSEIPPRDREKFKLEAYKAVTLEWVKQQIQELMKSAKKVA